MAVEILTGDCREVMRGMADSSVDAIVTDPPYGLSKEPDAAEVLRHWLAGDDYEHRGGGFMGKSWDSFVPGPTVWREAYRVLKPGGYLLSFFGSRTYDLGVIALRLAGFQVRDQVMWLHGQGFPKSRDVSKAIDAEAGAEREVVGQGRAGGGRSCMNDAPGHGRAKDYLAGDYSITAPATDAAQQWQGWGTALKPAHEPIVLARKPLVGTVAANVLAFGTGALNIDGCKVPGSFKSGWSEAPGKKSRGGIMNVTDESREPKPDNALGRWPANVLHDGSEDVEAAFAAFGEKNHKTGGPFRNGGELYGQRNKPRGHNDTGTASRFFYCSKASKADRDDGLSELPEANAKATNWSGKGMPLRQDGSERKEPLKRNVHPTVKPTTLMRYLCRLITPPAGVILDPFTGSGSTGRGAVLEGFNFIGIELSPEYAEIARRRIAAAAAKKDPVSGAIRRRAKSQRGNAGTMPEQLQLW